MNDNRETPRVPLAGGCHCENIQFTLHWPEAETEILKRMCGCRFCQLHQGAWTSHRDAKLSVAITDDALVSKYRFGTKTADFFVCSVCGVVPVVACEIDGDIYGIASVNALKDTGDFSLSSTATDFDGEDTGSRLDRRQRNWIPNVKIESATA